MSLALDPEPSTAAPAPGVRWPQMRRARTHNHQVPPGGHRRRRHEPRNLAAAHRPTRTRELYRRLIQRLAPTFDADALVLLLALVDLQDAGDTLNDVTITQHQLVDRIGGDDPRWGSGLYSIRRRLHWLEERGWISIEDVRLPSPGWQINNYRFHIPTIARPLWNTLSRQAEDARQRGLQRHQQSQDKAQAANGRHDAPQTAHTASQTPPTTAGTHDTSDDDLDDPPAPIDADSAAELIAAMRGQLRNRAGP